MSEITDADWKNAADFMNRHGWLCEEEWRDVLKPDREVIVKAWAEYREAAEAPLRAEVERLHKLLGDICIQSNPDWTGARDNPLETLDVIHEYALTGYYGDEVAGAFRSITASEE